MAITHLQFDDQKQHGRLLRRWLNAVESTLDDGDDIFRLLPTMIDGDGSSAAHFNEVVTRFGFPDNATAKAFWDEFQSAYSKVSGDAQVSSVNAAIKQIIAKCR